MGDTPPEIALLPVTAENWRRALELRVLPEQLRFVAGMQPIAALMLAKAYVRPDDETCDPYVIAHEGRLVGMLQLCYHEADPARCSLRHFFIDHREQGRGFGTAALHSAISLAAALPRCERIALTVHPENPRARQLYGRFGFERTGATIDGEPEYCLALPAR